MGETLRLALSNFLFAQTRSRGNAFLCANDLKVLWRAKILKFSHESHVCEWCECEAVQGKVSVYRSRLSCTRNKGLTAFATLVRFFLKTGRAPTFVEGGKVVSLQFLMADIPRLVSLELLVRFS